ncbi:Protein of unknown function [Methylobacterium pseudosasicola]|uniref:Glycosyltransferase 61 catalytic domain-containing protein n=1 Tax=Methylobacterium pseudosasicola TaxID=582667 RepID=A0A1I4RLW5_9HYPH|nr:Protein of unknown function [Methylobacterium pseudosasicola]
MRNTHPAPQAALLGYWFLVMHVSAIFESKKTVNDARYLVLSDGLVGPCSPDEAQRSWLHGFFGGVYDRNNQFVDMSITTRGHGLPVIYKNDSVELNGNYEYIDGNCLYCGPIFDHFGHFLLETTARLWPMVEGRFDRFIFQLPGGEKLTLSDYQRYFFSELGILDKIIVTGNGIRAKKLTIPSQASILLNCMLPEFTAAFDIIGSRHRDKVGLNKNIYISRSKIDIGRVVGEELLESAFAISGFDVIHPQELSPREQIEVFSCAEHLVGFQGSGLHNVLFARDGVKCTMFVRDSLQLDTYNNIDKVRRVNSAHIFDVLYEESFKPFPDRGPFCIDLEKTKAALNDVGLRDVAEILRAVSQRDLLDHYAAEWTYTAVSLMRHDEMTAAATFEQARHVVLHSRTLLLNSLIGR